MRLFRVDDIAGQQIIEGNPVIQALQQVTFYHPGINAVALLNRQPHAVIEVPEAVEQSDRVVAAQAAMDRTRIDAHPVSVASRERLARPHPQLVRIHSQAQEVAQPVIGRASNPVRGCAHWCAGGGCTCTYRCHSTIPKPPRQR